MIILIKSHYSFFYYYYFKEIKYPKENVAESQIKSKDWIWQNRA